MRHMIVFILVFAVFLCFIVLNLEHRCDVSLGFRTFYDIPVFLTSLFSFALGMLFVLPLVFTVGRKRKLKAARAETPRIEGSNIEASPPARKKFLKRKSSKKSDLASDGDKIQKEVSPYGID